MDPLRCDANNDTDTTRNPRKTRVHITPEVTLSLLRLCVKHSPFGGTKKKRKEAWETIFNTFIQQSSLNLGIKGIKVKVKRLMLEFKSNQLKYK